MLDPNILKKSETKFSELPRKEKVRETIKGVLSAVAVIAMAGMVICMVSLLSECGHFAVAVS